ncbi:MAG: hypothetical protein Q9217_001591 [Psora testacea]
MSTFHLPSTSPPVPVNLTADLSQGQLLSFPAFKTWINTLQHSLSTQRSKSHAFNSAPYRLRNIDIQAVDFFGEGRVGFVKLKAEVSNDKGEKLPGSVFLRGGSVGMLVECADSFPQLLKPVTNKHYSQLILQPDDVPEDTETEKQVILTLQPRVPAGSLAMAELPAGMLDDSGTFEGGAAKEIAEETGLEIPPDELLNLTELAISAPSSVSTSEEEHLQRAVYSSSGGSDEFIPLFLWQKRVKRDTLEQWQGKLTGLRDHGEKITLMLCPLEKVWRVAGRDAKALSAWAMYQGLRGDGEI